jgi:hypothetical protein
LIIDFLITVMAKNIKKSIKYFIIIIGVLIMIPAVLYPLLQISAIQTYLVNRITSHISKGLNSSITIGKIDYRFFNKLALYDILIKDQHNDTLLYTSEIVAGIRRFDIEKNIIKLGKVSIIKPVIGLITDSAGVMNLDYILKQLSNPEDTTKAKPLTLMADEIDLNDARFSLIDHSATKGKSITDFTNLRVTDINTIIEDLKIRNDTTSFTIYNLAFRESAGFNLKRMSTSVTIAPKSILLGSLFLSTDSSIINFSKVELKTDSAGSFKHFTTDVRLNVELDKSLISFSDLGYFLPFAEGIKESAWFSGKFLGTVSELRGRDILFSYGNNTSLDCDFDLSGLPNIDNTFIYIGVNSLRTNATDIQKIRINGKNVLDLPDAAYKLGTISFNGSFTGFTTDFVTYGELSTDQGRVRTDLSLRPEKSKRYTVKGTLLGSEINLGALTDNPDLFGKISFNTSVDGYAYSLKKFSANLTGRLDSLEFKRYTYRNVALNGIFTEKTWDGSINISDKNIRMDLLGMFDFSSKLPEFDFTLNLAHANLFNLNLDKSDSTSAASMLMTANFKGNNIDNLDGEIKLLNSNFVKYGNNLELYDFSVKTFRDNDNVKILRLRTDYVDADIKGNYNFAALGKLVKSTVSVLLPPGSRTMVQKSDLKKNNFTFDVKFKNTNNLNNFFRTGVLLADKSYIRGNVAQDTIMNIEVRSKSLNLKNNLFTDLAIDCRITGPSLVFDLRTSSLNLLMQSELKDFTVDFRTRPDSYIFTVDWDNKEKVLNRGNFTTRGRLVPNPTKKGSSVLVVTIDSSEIYARNNLWKIGNSTIKVDSNAVDIDRFYIRNKDNYYLVDGSVSENPSDTLRLEFKGIDISPLNYLGNQEATNNPDKTQYDIKGELNGKILLSNIYKDLLMETNLRINNFSILSDEFGTMSVASELDNAAKILNIKASNNLNGAKMIDINGYYDPSSKVANLTGVADKLTIGFLNPLLNTFASGISGTASGKVNLSLNRGNIYLTGAVFAENAKLKIDYLQAKFKLNDSVRFDRKGILFANVNGSDDKGNPVIVNGRVDHKSFGDFTVDLTINTRDALVLNTKPKDNDLFYGTAYATGVTTIKSNNDVLSFDISGRTGKNTKFFMPLNTSLSVSEYSFITFANTKVKKTGEKEQDEKNARPVSSSTGLDLNFDLEITPEAEAQLIFDSKVGDIMKGHGSGNLNITYDPKGNFKITGDYIVEDGDYLFTLGNILNKSFSVENGGKIMFNGDINNAEIDMKAIYKLKASLFPILQDENYKDRVPVECQLNLSGNLWNPVVGFNIYLPTADEKTRTYVRNAISTEEELSRQFLYLLVMNSFYADPSMGVASTAGSPSGTSAMAVTTFEMLSNQLSNWLSQISNDFDIGVVYRPGTGSKEMNPQEVQVALSTQILNDKVVINGNFDVPLAGSSSSSSTNNTNQITGDFDAEVKLTNKLNFKVFNRYNNPYTGKGVDYTQGIGIFFKQDFDKLSDLFRKKVKGGQKSVNKVPPKKK